MSNVLGVLRGARLYTAGYAQNKVFCIPPFQHSSEV